MSYAKTLRAVGAGHTVIVLAVDAPEAQRQRLESIGVLPGVELDVLADNGGSIRVLEKAGFVRMQVLEKAYEIDGVRYDDWVYRLECSAA